MQTDFVVQTDSFEGPLDTLLSLIEKRQLYINDISLAKVTADYIQYITDHQETIHNKTEFVGIASTLILAKSKSLLPDTTSDSDQEEINELEDRLRAYKLIKKRREELADQFGKHPLFSPRSGRDTYTENVFAPGDNLTADLLATYASQAVVSLPQESLPTANIEKTVSLNEEITRLKERCQAVESITFSSVVRSGDKRDHVVLFVAVLELIKSGYLHANQSNAFDEIRLESS